MVLFFKYFDEIWFLCFMVGLQFLLSPVVAMNMTNHLRSLICKIYQYINDLTMQPPKNNYFNFWLHKTTIFTLIFDLFQCLSYREACSLNKIKLFLYSSHFTCSRSVFDRFFLADTNVLIIFKTKDNTRICVIC